MELLLTGQEYQMLPKCFVIFICDYDPFDLKKYQYTFHNLCLEDTDLELGDDSFSIFLSTKGENSGEVSKELVKFLEFVGSDLTGSENDFADSFVKRLQKHIKEIKNNHEMGERYMTVEEWLADERLEARAEGIIQAILFLLRKKGGVSCACL